MTEPTATTAKAESKPKTSKEAPQPIVWDKLTDIDIALLTATAQGWRPDVGSEIRGRVLAVKIGVSTVGVKDGDPPREYPIVFILPDGANEDTYAVAVHGFHTVLMAELRSARPEFGDRIYLKSLGTLDRLPASKGMNAPEVYAVHVTGQKGSDKKSPWEILG